MVNAKSVEGGYTDAVLAGVPGGMKALLVEVHLVRRNLIRPLATKRELALRRGLLLWVLGRLDAQVVLRVAFVDMELVVVRSRDEARSIAVEVALEFVKNGVVLIEVAKARPKLFMDVDGLDGASLHVDVPELERHVISRQNVSTILRELDVRNGRDDLREKRAFRRVFLLFEDLAVRVAEGAAPHVRELDTSSAVAPEKNIAVNRVAHGGSDDLREFLHVGGFDIDNVEAGIVNS
mmetsp:Transcript_68581/g.161220  ORF Transcript_68581/g.161220 Transcript_68581/m.161220 type:complete len:236 (+) Transcript_68581:111-818(+)